MTDGPLFIGIIGMVDSMGVPKQIEFDDHKDRLIIKAYQNNNRKSGEIKKVAETLGVSVTTVNRRAAFLGVVRAANKTQIYWSDEELHILETASHLKVGSIINRLMKAGFKRRTEYSVLHKMNALGLGQRQSRYDAGIYTVKELERLSGIQSKTIVSFIEKGWLKASRRTDITQIEYNIMAKDVRQFFRDYTANVDIMRCDKFWLIDVLTGAIK